MSTRGSEAPIEGARILVDGTESSTANDGTATVTALRGAAVTIEAAGHDPAEATIPDEGALTVELRSNVLAGTVTDPDGAPVAGVRVFVEGAEAIAVTDEDGTYELSGVPEAGTLLMKMPGYRLVELALAEEMAADVVLEPFEARALYAPSAVFEAPGRLDAMLDLLERTEANALVIDVKETDGRLFYATDLPDAVEVGAVREAPIFDLEELLPQLKERGIYTIARMVVMKDNTTAAARPELAVMNAATGEPWRDNIGGAWLDPSAPGVAEYIAAIAGDLAAKGFDEVQLDYIRFFSDGPYAVADTNLPNTQSFRLPAIQRVLRVVSEELDATRTFLGADVFPISFIVPDDQGIGQRPEVIMPYVDYFCPMVYPSHYGPGVFGFEVPNNYPYEVIDRTLEIMNRQAEGLPGRHPAVDPGLRLRAVPAVHGRPGAGPDDGRRRARGEGLDDLERARDLHRGRTRSATEWRGRGADDVGRARAVSQPDPQRRTIAVAGAGAVDLTLTDAARRSARHTRIRAGGR